MVSTNEEVDTSDERSIGPIEAWGRQRVAQQPAALYPASKQRLVEACLQPTCLWPAWRCGMA